MTHAEALRAAIPVLRRAGVDDPARDARLLLAHATRLPPDRLTLQLNDPLAEDAGQRFQTFVAGRSRRQPVSQLTGTRLFWGRPFAVTPDTLDPRPETEALVAAALERPFAKGLDLGTGTGCILLSVLADRPSASGLGTDISEPALAVAFGNAQALGLTGRARFQRSDWCREVTGRFDLILSNPPYIAEGDLAALAPEVRDWEPRLALTPGGDGLGAYRRIAAEAPARLLPGGRLIVEIGPTQGPVVAGLFAAQGLESIAIRPDLDGRDRVVVATKPA